MNTYENKMLFLAPDMGGGEGSPGGDAGSVAGTGEVSRGAEVFEAPPKQTTGDHEPPPSKGTPPMGTPPVSAPSGPAPAAGAPPFDASKFAQEFGSVIGDALARRDTPPMTQEEARRMLNYWEPDDAWFAQYDNLDTRKDAVFGMRDAMIRQADTLSQMRMKEMINALRDEFMPHIQAAQAMSVKQRDDRFLGAYPQLNNPGLRPLIKAVADDLASQGKRFDSEEEAFTALAGGVEAVIKVNNPDFKLEAVSNDGQPTGRTAGRIPTTTPGSGGGTGRREGVAEPPKPRGLAIFDKIK